MQNILEIPQEILDSAKVTISDLKIELALILYKQNRLSVGKARELAGMSLWNFRQLLSLRKIPVHYGLSELHEDVALLDKIKFL